MKTIIISLATFLIFNHQAVCQSNYTVNNSLTKFVGTWEWSNGSDTVRLYLRKVKLTLDEVNQSCIDAIIGYHEYKNGTTTVEGNWSFRNETSFSNKSLLATNHNGNDVLNGNLRDITLEKPIHMELTLTNSGNSLVWVTSRQKAMTINQTDGFTLPQSITLTKVNTGGGTQD